MRRTRTYRKYLYSVSLFSSNESPSRLTLWGLSEPCEFHSSGISLPECAPTAEVFNSLPDYPPWQEEDDDDEGTSRHRDTDVLSPIRKKQRKKVRDSAGVKKAPARKSRKPKTSPPPTGSMRCLWGDDCNTKMEFDYTPETIKKWENHVASHLAKSGEPAADSVGKAQPKAKTVECMWDGCGKELRRDYIFRHIASHDARFKHLCPNGCGTLIRGDNLVRHLKLCQGKQ
jgi:hypothetical protein